MSLRNRVTGWRKGRTGSYYRQYRGCLLVVFPSPVLSGWQWSVNEKSDVIYSDEGFRTAQEAVDDIEARVISVERQRAQRSQRAG
jgi:hypothetical protein